MNKQEDSVGCYHILIKHNKSRTPLDRLRNIPVTRSQEEALKIIQVIRELLVLENLKHFSDLASVYSECSSAAEGGNLGTFSKGEMQEAFEKVAFALKIGELSQPVSTDSGIHLILRSN